jgi:hypothetical protein
MSKKGKTKDLRFWQEVESVEAGLSLCDDDEEPEKDQEEKWALIAWFLLLLASEISE